VFHQSELQKRAGMGRALGVGLGLAVAFGLTASNARADNAPTGAQSLFEHGRALRLRGDCASAIPYFRRAYDAYPNGLGSLRNIAECEEASGHFAAARSAWIELGRSLLSHAESRYAGWPDDAAQAVTRLTPKLGTLTIDVHATPAPGAPGPGAGAPSPDSTDIEVSINGERLSPSLVGTPVLRDPGHYVVRAVSRAGEAMQEEPVDLASGDTREVDLTLHLLPPEPTTAAAHEGSSAGRNAMMWTAFALGTASFIGAGIAEAERQSALGDANNAMAACAVHSPSCTLQAQQSINDRGNAAATWETAFFIAGGVGVATGVVLLAVAQSGTSVRSGVGSRARDPQGAKAALVVSPSALSITGEF
jgi:hypothetical protein